MDAIITILQSIFTADNVVNLLGVSGGAALVSAYISSKSKAKNPFLRFVDQLLRDVLNAIGFNFNKANNSDDDR